MASNGAAQTAQAQQGNQQQSEQFLQQQQQQAFANLQKYMQQNPNPVQGWGAIQGPQTQAPQSIGGGTATANGVNPPAAQQPGGGMHRMATGMAQNALGSAMQPQNNVNGTAGANSSATSNNNPVASGVGQAAAASGTPQGAALAGYLQAWQMMQARNQTQMHGGGIQ